MPRSASSKNLKKPKSDDSTGTTTSSDNNSRSSRRQQNCKSKVASASSNDNRRGSNSRSAEPSKKSKKTQSSDSNSSGSNGKSQLRIKDANKKSFSRSTETARNSTSSNASKETSRNASRSSYSNSVKTANSNRKSEKIKSSKASRSSKNVSSKKSSKPLMPQSSFRSGPSQTKGATARVTTFQKANSNRLPGATVIPATHLRALWMSAGPSVARKRLMIVMRAVERMDRVHGAKWESTEIVNGWPLSDQKLLPLIREKCDFKNDPPITKLGRRQAQLTMRAIMLRGLKPKKIICSPALRSVQTASAMAKYCGGKICIEPGLLEPTPWYSEKGILHLPSISIQQFFDFDYPVDKEYKPIVQNSYFEHKESELEARQRIDLVLRNLGLSNPEGPLLIIGHAITLHTTYFIGKRKPTEDPSDADYNELDVTSTDEHWDSEKDDKLNLGELGLRYPPGCIVTIAREADGPPAVYQLVPGIIPPLSYGQQFSNKPVHQDV